MKKCSRCKEVKEDAEFNKFYKSPDGLGSYCKVCSSEYGKKHNDARQKHPRVKIEKFTYGKNGFPELKRCGRCKEFKPVGGFNKDRSLEFELAANCKECALETSIKYDPRVGKKLTQLETGHKVCHRCGIDKPVAEFSLKDGGKTVNSKCKKCVTAITKEYKQTHKDKVKTWSRKARTAKSEIDRAGKLANGWRECAMCGKLTLDSSLCLGCFQKQKLEEHKRKKAQEIEKNRLLESARAAIRWAKDMVERQFERNKKFRVYACKQCGSYMTTKRKLCPACKKTNLKDQQNHKDRMREARERGAVGSYKREEWLELLELCNNECLMYHEPSSEYKLTRDHIIPLAEGGSNYICNIQPLCLSHNSKKGNRNMDDLRPQAAIDRFGKPK